MSTAAGSTGFSVIYGPGNHHVTGTGRKRVLQAVSDFYDDQVFSSTIGSQAVSEPASEDIEETTIDPETAEPPSAPEAKQEPEVSPAVARFKSCRWHETPDAGVSYCSHRDVLPFAGKNGFNPESWCPECEFFKVKRTVKKRAAADYNDYY